MMRGMKEEGKMMGPMFPRLHVNDAEKGGPRAPPRNKMALYEQLSIPSQRSSGSAPLLPLSPNDSTGLAPSTFSSHIGGRRRVMLTSFCKSPVSSRGAEKLTSYSSTAVKFKDVPKDEIRSSNLVITKPLSSDYKCDKNEETRVSKSKNLLLEKSRDGLFSSPQFQAPSDPHLTGACFKDLKSEEKKKLTLNNQFAAERSSTVPIARNKPLVDPSPSPSKLQNSEWIRRHDESSGGEIRSKFDDISNRLHGVNTARDNLDFKPEKLLRPSKDVGKSSLIPPSKDNKRNILKNGSKPEEDNPKQSVSSTLKPASTNVISPDDVVEVIGEKQFWDARKAIINQQRIFAVQVFELHRVIKVQRLIAESPNILLDDYLYSKKASPKVWEAKKLSTEHPLEPSPLSSMHKFDGRNPISLPSCKNDAFKGLVIKQPVNDLPSKNIPQALAATSSKPEPWCFNPLPASQWLVPVMSPSEGLIYKPVAGLCPPNAGFISPNYSILRPTNMNSAIPDLFDAAYGVPAEKQGLGVPQRTPYFPPYSLPPIHQSLSCSAVDQSPCPKTRSNEQDNQASVNEINNYTVQHQNSYNMSCQTSRVMTSQAQKVRGIKGSELQGSTASSPPDKGNTDVLPLFPMAPTMEESDQNTETSENRSRVIKVVPHNPRTATESAARIFQLIQEERKQM